MESQLNSLVSNLYNPHAQSKERIIQSFVVRQGLFNRLFHDIKSSKMFYPEQHYLIVGQRGSGKTTLLLRLNYEIENDSDLNTWLIPIILKEEAYYRITQLFKLWETIAQELETKNSLFVHLVKQMTGINPEEKEYERTCFNMLNEALLKHSIKIIIFIDNIGEMFLNFSEHESQRLREVLMCCPHLRIIGATTIVFEAFFNYKHPFYEFFKIKILEGLSKYQTNNLLMHLAKVYNKEHAIQSIIKQNPGKIESLRIMTGGVIRSIVLLFEIFIDNAMGNAIGDLEQILDRVTPLYKHRMDDLFPIQREIVDVIALNWDAISAEDIANKTHRTYSEVTIVLKELEKAFIVQRVATKTQLSLFYLRERFFNIWYLMRLAPTKSQKKVIWLVRFLESWYEKNELLQKAKNHIEIITKGHYSPQAAFYLTEALSNTGYLDMDTEHLMKIETKKFLDEKDKSLACILSQSDADLFEEGNKFLRYKEYEKACNRYLKIKNKNKEINYGIGLSFYRLDEPQKAETYFLKAAEEKHKDALYGLGLIYNFHSKDIEKAEKYYLMAIEEKSSNATFYLGKLYKDQFRNIKKSIKYFSMGIEKEDVKAMYALGDLYENIMKNSKKAKKYYLMAIEKSDNFFLKAIEKNDSTALNQLCWFYYKEKINKEDALKIAKKAVEQSNDRDYIHTLACIYIWNNQFENAFKIDKTFMYVKRHYKDDISRYLMLLIAKKQYLHVAKYFENTDLELKDRYKLIYYSLLFYTKDINYEKIPPELSEPVKDIIGKIKRMERDYQ